MRTFIQCPTFVLKISTIANHKLKDKCFTLADLLTTKNLAFFSLYLILSESTDGVIIGFV